MHKINILIADTSEIYRVGLDTALRKYGNINIVGTCGTGEETIQKAAELKPDIVLMDENIAGPDCIEVSRQIRASLEGVRLIIFTEPVVQTRDPFYVFGTQASGYVDRQTDSGNLISIVNRVMTGDFFVSPLQGKKLVEELNNLKTQRKKKQRYAFTRREKDILKHIAEGLTNREIALKLFVTENTVKAYVARVMQKMQLQNRHQVMLAVSQGMVADLE